MKIILNGKEEKVSKCNLQKFIDSKISNQSALVVEHNFKIVTTKEWSSIELKDNDNLELLSFVGGG